MNLSKIIIFLSFLFIPQMLWAATYGGFVPSNLNSIQKCQHLVDTYSESINDFNKETHQVTFVNGHKLSCDDGQVFDLTLPEGYLDQLDQVDISDILLQDYPFEYSAPIFEKNFSPGRFRNDQVFINTYLNLKNAPSNIVKISSKMELSSGDLKKLAPYLDSEIVKVNFLGSKVNMNKRNQAAAALKKVSERLLNEVPEAAQWIQKNRNMSGGYNMRFISGTKRLSSHSWGVAIDFTIRVETPGTKWFDSYWKWVAQCLSPLECPQARTKDSIKIRREAKESELAVQVFEENFDHFKKDVVRIFAEEGFIWGGHWNHFDTMHFEYRPELFKKI